MKGVHRQAAVAWVPSVATSRPGTRLAGPGPVPLSGRAARAATRGLSRSCGAGCRDQAGRHPAGRPGCCPRWAAPDLGCAAGWPSARVRKCAVGARAQVRLGALVPFRTGRRLQTPSSGPARCRRCCDGVVRFSTVGAPGRVVVGGPNLRRPESGVRRLPGTALQFRASRQL